MMMTFFFGRKRGSQSSGLRLAGPLLCRNYTGGSPRVNTMRDTDTIRYEIFIVRREADAEVGLVLYRSIPETDKNNEKKNGKQSTAYWPRFVRPILVLNYLLTVLFIFTFSVTTLVGLLFSHFMCDIYSSDDQIRL